MVGLFHLLVSRWSFLLFVLVLLGASVLRLHGVNWDAGYSFHPDERSIYLQSDCIFRLLKALPYQDCLHNRPDVVPGFPSVSVFFDSEKSPLNPISLYGITKVEAEKNVMKYRNVISFRLATVFGYSYRMRTDLLVNNFVFKSIKDKKLTIYEPHFRRNYIHVDDVVDGIIFSLKNFNRLKSNIYNLGLSSANLTKYMLVKKIKKQLKYLKIKIIHNKKDPDQRDYYVSNRKIEKKGFRATISIDNGITELIKIFSYSKEKIINNY